MTEYWKSKSRHYCAVCNCWLDSNPRSIRSHEDGKQHQDSVERNRTKQREQKVNESVEHDELQRQLDLVNKAANEKYHQHDSPSTSSSQITSPSSTSHSNKPHKRLRNESSLRPESPWQTTLDRSTNMPYYYHPITQQTTWNINDTFTHIMNTPSINVQHDDVPHSKSKLSDSDDVHVDSLSAHQETEQTNEIESRDDDVDEMGLPKFEPVDVVIPPDHTSTSHDETTSTESSNTTTSSRLIDRDALAALPAGLFKKRKKA